MSKGKAVLGLFLAVGCGIANGKCLCKLLMDDGLTKMSC